MVPAAAERPRMRRSLRRTAVSSLDMPETTVGVLQGSILENAASPHGHGRVRPRGQHGALSMASVSSFCRKR
jgi:hypothetical protein